MPSVENIDLHKNWCIWKHATSFGVLSQLRSQEIYGANICLQAKTLGNSTCTLYTHEMVAWYCSLEGQIDSVISILSKIQYFFLRWGAERTQFVPFIFRWLHKSNHEICEFAQNRSCLKTKPPFLMTSQGRNPIKNGASLTQEIWNFLCDRQRAQKIVRQWCFIVLSRTASEKLQTLRKLY